MIILKTYDGRRQICNPFSIEPNPLPERLFITSNTSSTDLFHIVAFEPVQTPKKVLWFGSADTSKTEPATGSKMLPNNQNHVWIKSKVGHEAALASLLVEAHHLATKLIEVLG